MAREPAPDQISALYIAIGLGFATAGVALMSATWAVVGLMVVGAVFLAVGALRWRGQIKLCERRWRARIWVLTALDDGEALLAAGADPQRVTEFLRSAVDALSGTEWDDELAAFLAMAVERPERALRASIRLLGHLSSLGLDGY